MRQAGLFVALPWAAATSFFLLAAPVLVWAGAALPWPWPHVAWVTAGLAWVAVAIGSFLLAFLGTSGHVTRPAGRAFGGVAAGLAGATALSVASCTGLLSVAVPDDGLALLVAAAVSGLAAAPLAATWARLRYDASRDGRVFAAAWALALGGLPPLLYLAARAL